MRDSSFEVGRVVFAKAGRDAGRYFMVLSVIDDDYVTIVDGVYRKLMKPKKKKIRHLSTKPVVLQGIAEKVQQGKKVFDAEIRSALQNTEYGKQAEQRKEG